MGKLSVNNGNEKFTIGDSYCADNYINHDNDPQIIVGATDILECDKYDCVYKIHISQLSKKSYYHFLKGDLLLGISVHDTTAMCASASLKTYNHDGFGSINRGERHPRDYVRYFIHIKSIEDINMIELDFYNELINYRGTSGGSHARLSPKLDHVLDAIDEHGYSYQGIDPSNKLHNDTYVEFKFVFCSSSSAISDDYDIPNCGWTEDHDSIKSGLRVISTFDMQRFYFDYYQSDWYRN